MDLKGKYGLIIPAKERSEAKANAAASVKPPPRNKNVFGDDSDSEEDEDTDWVKKTMKKQSQGSIQQKQSVQAIKQALADDPTVYQYDELYDDMEKKRVDGKESQKEGRKAKYIHHLLKTAEKRKYEDEARQERLVQKEREKEGDMFKDKEAFVTGAYRKKMEELEKVKEEERRRDALDALVDVTKQNDLSGFYRHLYRQKVEEPEALKIKQEEESSDKKESCEKKASTEKKLSKEKKSSSEKNKTNEIKDCSEVKDNNEIKTAAKIKNESDEEEATELNKSGLEKASEAADSCGSEVVHSEEHLEEEIRNIWAKRTVGPAFDNALMRYYARKEARLQTNTNSAPLAS